LSDDLGFIHRYEPGDPSLTLLLLHGTGGSEDDLLSIGRAVAPKASLLSPRGKSLDEGMPRFFRRFGEGQFDEKDIVFRSNELADFVAAAAAKYKFGAQRVFALGYSNGANIAAAMLLLRPEALAGGMLLRAMVPLMPELPPDMSGKQVLLCEGKNDGMVSVENANRLATMFKTYGANVSLFWSDAGHGLTQDDLAACAEWLTRRQKE